MVDTLQPNIDVAAGTPSVAPTPIDPGIADAASKMADEFGKINAEAAKSQPAEVPEESTTAAAPTAAPALPGPVIPPAPAPSPGAYSPEKEQYALRLANAIKDPLERLRVQGRLKQEYANDALMDGVIEKNRQQAIQTGVGQYSRAIIQIQDDPHADWQTKQAIARKLVETMRQDPRLDYGNTKVELEAHMLGLAGIQDTRGLGPFFSEGFNGVVNGSITSSRQILQMEAQQKLTAQGANHLIQTLGQMDKPDQRVLAEQQALAFKRVNETVLKDQELDINNNPRPNGKQLKMVNDIQYAILDQVKAAGQDLDKVGKITSAENVDKVIEAKYPWYERHLDRVSFGVPVNVGGIVVPPFVDQNPQTVTAYRDITAAPPFAVGKDGKPHAMEQTNWQKAVNILLANQTNPEARPGFKRLFPDQDPDRIIAAVKTVTPPPGTTPAPTVRPPEQEGWLQYLFRPRSTPGAGENLLGQIPGALASLPRGPGVTVNLAQELSNRLAQEKPSTQDQATVNLAKELFNRIRGEPSQEAKK